MDIVESVCFIPGGKLKSRPILAERASIPQESSEKCAKSLQRVIAFTSPASYHRHLSMKYDSTRITGKNAKQKLSASEDRYRRLFEAARDGILILDAATGRITEVNPFMSEFLGYSREEFVGKQLWE